MIHLNHPEVANRSCADCQQFMYDDAGTEIGSKRMTQRGLPLLRPAGVPTPCYKCPKSDDKQTPNPDAEMSRKNYAAFHYYLEIKAGARMPDDGRVRKNCALIRRIEDAGQRSRDHELTFLIRTLVTLLKIKQ